MANNPRGMNLEGICTLRTYLASIIKNKRHEETVADALKMSVDKMNNMLEVGAVPHISTAVAIRIASVTDTHPRELLYAQVETKMALSGVNGTNLGPAGIYPDTIKAFSMTKNDDDNGGHDSLIMDDGFIIK